MFGTGGYAAPAGAHLMVIFDIQGGDCFLVPVVSGHAKGGCNLEAGQHEFIKHESRIDFSFACKLSQTALLEQIAAGPHVEMKPITSSFARQMYEAFLISDDVEPWFEKACRARVRGFLEKLH